MRKAMSQNPNMLRTLMGLGFSLIFILGYAVYAATVDSDYYLYHTTNDASGVEVENVLDESGNETAVWQFETAGALTWINLSFEGLPAGATVHVEASAGDWWSSPLLGDAEATGFNCRTLTGDFEVINTCARAASHTVETNQSGSAILRGLGSPDLSLSGTASLTATSLEDAEIQAANMIEAANYSRVWTITVESDDEVHPGLVDITGTVVVSEVTGVEHYQIDPITELIWSVTALIGCFGMALVIPMTVYLAARAKEKRDDRLREAKLVAAEHAQS